MKPVPYLYIELLLQAAPYAGQSSAPWQFHKAIRGLYRCRRTAGMDARPLLDCRITAAWQYAAKLAQEKTRSCGFNRTFNLFANCSWKFPCSIRIYDMESIYRDYADSVSTAWKGEDMAVEETNLQIQAGSEKRTYSVQEIADILQISRSMAYNLCRQSLFKTVKVGKYVRISKSSFDDWLDSKN